MSAHIAGENVELEVFEDPRFRSFSEQLREQKQIDYENTAVHTTKIVLGENHWFIQFMKRKGVKPQALTTFVGTLWIWGQIEGVIILT